MNKNIIITGGAGGLGLEIVKQHLAKQDRVWVLDLARTEAMTRLREGRQGTLLHFEVCDVSSTEPVERALQGLKTKADQVDVIYSCAGICRNTDRVPLGLTDLDAIAEVVDINAVGFLRVVKVVLPLLKNGCHIVCVTSEAASITNNHRSGEFSYVMSKAAENMGCAILQHYFREIGQDTRVFCLHPGWLKTEMGGGDIAEVDPADSAAALVKIAEEADRIPEDLMFMDYQRKAMPW